MLACIFADDSDDAGIQWSMGTTMRLGSHTFVAPISANGFTSCASASCAMATSTLQSTTSPTDTDLLPDVRASSCWGRDIPGIAVCQERGTYGDWGLSRWSLLLFPRCSVWASWDFADSAETGLAWAAAFARLAQELP